MTDKKIILICVAVGLALAFAVSGPLRHPKTELVGTPLVSNPSEKESTSNESSTETQTSNPTPLYVKGTILLDASAEKAAKTAQALFLVVKAHGMQGAPLAVKKIEQPQFPMEFSLAQSDSMFGSDYYDGDIVLSVKLDQDGAVGAKSPQDIEAVIDVKKDGNRTVSVTLFR